MVSVAETPSSGGPGKRHDRDPLARVLALGGGAVITGSLLGVIGALALHGAFAARGVMALIDLGDFAKNTLAVVLASRTSEVDVDTLEPETKEEPEPPPPEEKPDPKLQPIPTAPAPEQPAPEAAQAGQALTAEPDPDEPLDFGDKIVTGPGTSYAGGSTAAKGTSTKPVRDPRAKATGGPGGTGTGRGPPGPPPSPAKNLARNPTPQTLNWNCGFPAEADMEQIDYATVMLSVTVGADGRAKTVSVLKDPGYGFGQLARSCALRMRYSVGLDTLGKPITKTTPPFPVRFTR